VVTSTVSAAAMALSPPAAPMPAAIVLQWS
jgi:hypothetical protein